VHDPAYGAAAHAETAKRVDRVYGVSNVRRLISDWQPVQGVWFQGLPPSYLASPNQMECMGRSAQWVEETANGTLSWTPNRDN
jgi:hypothetical protein